MNPILPGQPFNFTALPFGIQQQVFSFVAEPETTRLVCNKWKVLTNLNLCAGYQKVIGYLAKDQIDYLYLKYFPGDGPVPIARFYLTLLHEQSSELFLLSRRNSVMGYRKEGELNFPFSRIATSPEDYLRRERWIIDENLLRCCAKIPSLTEPLNLMLDQNFGHHQIAKGLRSMIRSGEHEEGVLSLDCVGLTRFPSELIYFRRLKQLSCNCNQLQWLPGWFQHFQFLNSLALNKNKICFLPEEIGELLSLENLDLTSNRLKTLPLSLARLVRLSSLDLSDNQIEKIPHGIGKLSELVRLYMKTNQLQELPEEIKDLKSLEVIDLRNNQIRALPDNFLELPNLHIVYFGENGRINRVVQDQTCHIL